MGWVSVKTCGGQSCASDSENKEYTRANVRVWKRKRKERTRERESEREREREKKK